MPFAVFLFWRADGPNVCEKPNTCYSRRGVVWPVALCRALRPPAIFVATRKIADSIYVILTYLRGNR